MRSVWLLLLISLVTSGLAQPTLAVPVDAPERLLPMWTQYKEVECAQAAADTHEQAAGVQHGPIVVQTDSCSQLSRWKGVPDGSPPDLTWRESFLVSRENTKYKEVAVSH